MQSKSNKGSSQLKNPYAQRLQEEDLEVANGALCRSALLLLCFMYLLEHAPETQFVPPGWFAGNIVWFLPTAVFVVSILIYRGFVHENIEAKSRLRWAILSFFALTAPMLLLCFLFTGLNALGMMTWIFAYDPINAAAIVLLILLAPISNIWLLPVLVKKRIDNPLSTGLLNGAALGTSLLFGFLLLPSVIIASIGCVSHPFLGGPFEFFVSVLIFSMMLSPYSVCLMSSLLCTAIWRMKGAQGGLQTSLFSCLGLVLSLLLLICPGVKTVVTNIATVKAATQNSEASSAVRYLRAFESIDDLLRLAYFENVPRAQFLPVLYSNIAHDTQAATTPRPELARKAIYRITGKNFNAFKKPSPAAVPEGLRIFTVDTDRGGAEVAALNPDLKLTSSEMNCFAYKDTLASRVEWSLQFENTNHNRDAEARLLILLPPNAVASGLRLYVNGKAREAVFGNRGVVRSAYSNIVSQRRDPALLSWAGNDRVLLQCFPVRATEPMRLSLQIAAPFVMSSTSQAQIMLPRVIESNCSVLEHTVRYRALKQNETDSGFDKTVENNSLVEPIARIEVTSFKSVVSNQEQIEQVVTSSAKNDAKSLLFVVDCGANTQEKLGALGEAIGRLPESVKAGVIYATDEISNLKPFRAANNAELGRQVQFNHPRCLGGPDNLPALQVAFEQMQRDRELSVVWVHGPQPVVFACDAVVDGMFSMDEMNGRPLYEIEMIEGPNKISEYVGTALFEKRRPVRLLRGHGSFESSVAETLLCLVGEKNTYSIVRNASNRFAQSRSTFGDGNNAQLTACALWASNTADGLYERGFLDDAAALSKKHRVVTRATSAVVLESDRQYKEAGLDGDQANPYSAEFPVDHVTNPSAANALVTQMNSLSCAAASAGPSAGSASFGVPKPQEQANSREFDASEPGVQIYQFFVWTLAALVGTVLLFGGCKKRRA